MKPQRSPSLVATGLGFSCGMAMVSWLLLQACHLAPAEKTAASFGEKAACAIANAEAGDATVKTICNLADEDMPAILNIVSAHQKKMEAIRLKMKTCGLDVPKSEASVDASRATPETSSDAGKPDRGLK